MLKKKFRQFYNQIIKIKTYKKYIINYNIK